jgi:hypothetical protein
LLSIVLLVLELLQLNNEWPGRARFQGLTLCSLLAVNAWSVKKMTRKCGKALSRLKVAALVKEIFGR